MTAQQTFRNTLVVLLTLAIAYAVAASIRILIVVLVAIIIASALRPFILWLEKRRIPQGLAILIVYGLIGLFVFVLGVLILPPSINQLSVYLQNEERLAGRIVAAQSFIERSLEQTFGGQIDFVEPQVLRERVTEMVTAFTAEFPNMAAELGATLGETILTFVVGVYWLTARDQAVQFSTSLFSIGRRGQIQEILTEIETSLGNYVRGIMMVVVFVGVANFAILSLAGVPNAVTLAFIIGITTAIPVLGGFIGAGLAVLLALLSSPVHALITFASFVLVQQVEVHYLTPRTMAKSVGLNPILVITVLFIGFSLGGIMGALLAIPVAGTVYILMKHLLILPRQEESAPQLVQGGILIASKTAAAPGAEIDAATRTPIKP